MEPSKEPISVRVTRLNNQILLKDQNNISNINRIIAREGLLDALTVLYDECNNETLKHDKNISLFIEKFRPTLLELKKLRVNISDFEVKAVIGRGHFGEVNVVREKQTGDVYAMKTLRKAETINQHSISFYEEERDIMALAKSPWLTTLQYAFQDSAHLYLIMEFHPGGDLLALLERHGGTLTEPHAKFYLAELSLALQALHTMGYVHRDIKPDNILLDRCGHLKLADFGSAAKLSPQGKVMSKMPVGTPEYIAPEVLKAMESVGSYGVDCDFWSLGIVAYEMIVGCTPFTGEALTMVYNNIMNHSSKLTYPPDTNISAQYKSFIGSLLTDVNARMKHNEIINHSFFKDVNWSCLRDQVPPFVPKVNSIDDTSNFIEFEHKTHVPSIDNFKTKKQFSGKNLPFIGFTYTNESTTPTGDLDTSIRSNISANSHRSILEGRKKEVENLQKQLAQATSGGKEFEVIKKRLNEQIKQMKLSEESRQKMEKDLAQSKNHITHLKRTLEAERLERKELEQKALDLIKGAKRKWEAAEAARVAQLHEQVDESTQRVTELCTLNNELTSKLERAQMEFSTTQEELKRLMNLEADYKEIMAKTRAMSRKSVAGVQIQLDKISTDMNDQMKILQSKVESEIKQRTSVESELRHYKNSEQKLKNELEVEKSDNLSLKKEIDELNESCKGLEKYRKEIEEKEKDFECFKKENKTTILELKMELKAEKESSTQLREELKSVEKKAKITEKELEKSKSNLTEQEDKFKTDLTILKDELVQTKNERKSIQNKLREVQESDEVNRSRVSDLEELLARLEQGVARLEANDGQEDQITKLENQIKSLHESLASEKIEARNAKTALWKKEKELSDCDLDKRILTRELKTAEAKVKTLAAEIETLTKRIEEKDNEGMKNESDYELKIKQYEGIISGLKNELSEAKVEIEKNCEEAKKNKNNFDKYINKLTVSLSEVESLKKTIANIEQQNDHLKEQVNRVTEEKFTLSHNLNRVNNEYSLLENKLTQYNRDLDNLNLNHNILKDTCTMLETQLEDYEKLIENYESKDRHINTEKGELVKKLENSQEEVSKAMRLMNEEKSLRLLAEKRCTKYQNDLEECRQDIQNLSTQLAEYKAACNDLNQQLVSAEDRAAQMDVENRTLERKLESMRSEEILVKEESTHHLTLLHELKQANLKVNGELENYKEDIVILRSHVAELENKLQEQMAYYQQRELKSEATQQQQTKLIHYLQSKLEEQNKKKKTFTDKIFGSSKKENIVPLTPHRSNIHEVEARLQHEKLRTKSLTEQLSRVRLELAAVKGSAENSETVVETKGAKRCLNINRPDFESWVKIANDTKFLWAKKYIRLYNTKLSIFNDSDSTTATSVIDLSPEDGFVQLITEVSPNECGNTAHSDIPYIFKIELNPSTTCWPKTTTYIMTLSNTLKQNWIEKLKVLIPENATANDQIGTLTMKSDSEPYCAIEFEDVVLVGTENGLCSATETNDFVLLKGITHVHQMAVSLHLSLLVMIAGENRQLLKSHLSHVRGLIKAAACSSPMISVQLIASDRFNVFELSQKEMMCAATQKKIVILKYDSESQNYLPVRMLDTAQPCSCILFREHSLIVGANKFFEIDVRDFSAEEFLDASDNSLSHVIGCYKLNSFPIALIDVSRDIAEYLLCFNEFGIFVDEFGRRTRENDFKWTHLPIAFGYCKPYLFVTQFNAIEVQKIGSKTMTYSPVRVEISNPKYLGLSKHCALYFSHFNEVRVLKSNEFTDDSVTTENDNSEFSFTSSLVESLDRVETNSDDEDSEVSNCRRRVRFDGTHSHTAM